MSGTGGLTKSGSGTVILPAPTATPAARRCRAASCRATRTSLQGNILNNATVVVQPGGQRHLCRRDVGQRRHDPAGRRRARHHRQQHLHRRRPRSTPARLVVNGSLASTVTLTQRRHAGRQRHDRRRWSPTAACWRPATRSARSTSTATSARTAAPTWSRPMPQGQSDRINATGTATINGAHGAGDGRARQLRHQHDLHHPQCHRRRERHLLRRHAATSPS